MEGDYSKQGGEFKCENLQEQGGIQQQLQRLTFIFFPLVIFSVYAYSITFIL